MLVVRDMRIRSWFSLATYYGLSTYISFASRSKSLPKEARGTFTSFSSIASRLSARALGLGHLFWSPLLFLFAKVLFCCPWELQFPFFSSPERSLTQRLSQGRYNFARIFNARFCLMLARGELLATMKGFEEFFIFPSLFEGSWVVNAFYNVI
jgi:hypothetical protein